jgi:hypothetical protein
MEIASMRTVNLHYAQFVKPFIGGGFCVQYDLKWACGHIVDGLTGKLKRFEEWSEAYDVAARLFHDRGHPASDPGAEFGDEIM